MEKISNVPPKFMVGEIVYVNDFKREHTGEVIAISCNDNHIYMIDGCPDWVEEKNVYRNKQCYNISRVLSRNKATTMYANVFTEVIDLCETKTKLLLEDTTELIIEFPETDAVKFADFSATFEHVKVSKIKIVKEDDICEWFVYDENDSDKWVTLFENYWDNMYVVLDTVLTMELDKKLKTMTIQ